MSTAARSFTVLETPARAWAAAADVNRWVLALPEAEKKGWGDRWSAQALGPGAPVAMLLGGRVAQEWQVEDWQPGRRLRLASRAWRGTPQASMASSLQLGLTQVKASETLVELRLESRFDAPNWGWFLNLIVPLKKDLDRILARMEKGVLDVLSGA